MLETIRQLSRTVKLKDIIIANFIPEDYAKSIEKRAVWNDSDDYWTVQVSVYIFTYAYFFLLIVNFISHRPFPPSFLYCISSERT